MELIILLIKMLIKGATLADKAYYANSDNEFDSIVLSENEKLNNMNPDDLIVCYQSVINNNYSILNAVTNLNNFRNHDFGINDIIYKKNCIYLKISYALPYKQGENCFSTSFSLNYMFVNSAVAVYGFQTQNPSEKEAFTEIAKKLTSIIST
jgi:hypothetical protein